MDTINNLRLNINGRNKAYEKLKVLNEELEDAKASLRITASPLREVDEGLRSWKRREKTSCLE